MKIYRRESFTCSPRLPERTLTPVRSSPASSIVCPETKTYLLAEISLKVTG